MKNDNDETEEKGADWLDFKAIKANTEVKPVLEHFEILQYLKENDTELVGWCPPGREHGKEDSFCFNFEKKTFQCFACKARGSVLDFIAKYQNIPLRDAAKIALKIAVNNSAELTQEDLPESKRPYKKLDQPATNSVETPAPEKHSEEKHKTSAKILPIFTWDQAQNLVEMEMVDADRLVVLNVDSLNIFLTAAIKARDEIS